MRHFRCPTLACTLAGSLTLALALTLQALPARADDGLPQAQARYEAAARRGDPQATEQALRALLALERTPRRLNDLGLFVSDRGDFADAERLLQEAVDKAPPDSRGFYQANLALNLRRQFRDAEAAAVIDQALQALAHYAGSPQGWRPANLARSRGLLWLQRSRLHERAGRGADAQQAARHAESAARQALTLAPAQASALERRQIGRDIANALRRQSLAALADGDLVAAESGLVRWAGEVQAHGLDPETRAQGLETAAQLQLALRRLATAERHAREALAVYAELGWAPLHLARLGVHELLLQVLWLRGRGGEAAAELALLDEAARAQPQAAARARLPLVRGLLALDGGRPADAVPLFDERVQQMAASAGAGSLAWAEAFGLKGLAQWRSGAREAGATALAQAVAVLVQPAHADLPDPSGMRQRLREMLVAGWIQTLPEGRSAAAMDALAVLDWARSGPTQRALTDAAARARLPDAELRAWAREAQDLRREADALRRFAAGEDERRAWTPELGQRVQQRLLELDQRQRPLRARLQSAHPAWLALAAPALPTAAELAARLDEGEGLLVLQPDGEQLLAWTLHRDGGRFARLPLPASEAAALVGQLRATLDLGLSEGRVRSFDRQAARQLYRRLLEPLEADLQGLSHLVVVAGGPLATLPLAVLLTADGPLPYAQAPWLARRHAFSQAPGVAGWLAARSRRGQPAAAEPLLAWGDPLFGLGAAAATQPPGATVAAPGPAGTSGVTRTSSLSRIEPPSALDAAGAAAVQRGALRYSAIPPLPETRAELQAIAGAVQARAERDLLFGAAATRESVLAADADGRLARQRVVAFATHGLLPGDLPGLAQPALALANPRGSDGDALAAVLQLDDVLTLRLQADWVVLSACNSASADGRAEEALSGLARGFFSAGARSLLVTHWAVESDSAAQLSARTFAHQAAQPTAPKAHSLRQAMLEVMAQPKWSHPAYWAPYAVVGDGGR